MKTIKYDIQYAAVASCSATGYIMMQLMDDEFKLTEKWDPKNLTLQIINMTEISNLQMLKAFVDDLIDLEKQGVTIQLMNG